MQTEGVEWFSPVLNLNATLAVNEYKLDREIWVVFGSFPSLTFIHGSMCLDSSNMPYLILNKAVAKAISHEHQPVTISSDDTVIINTNGMERKTIVYDIFDDGSETPTMWLKRNTE